MLPISNDWNQDYSFSITDTSKVSKYLILVGLNMLDELGSVELMIVDREVYVKVNYNNSGCGVD